jgi:hypothetical protein
VSRSILTTAALWYVIAGVMLSNAAWLSVTAIKTPSTGVRFGIFLVAVFCILYAIAAIVVVTTQIL